MRELCRHAQDEILRLGLHLSQQFVHLGAGERLVDAHDGGAELGVSTGDLENNTKQLDFLT